MGSLVWSPEARVGFVDLTEEGTVSWEGDSKPSGIREGRGTETWHLAENSSQAGSRRDREEQGIIHRDPSPSTLIWGLFQVGPHRYNS